MSILKYKDPKTGEFKRINPYKADLSFVGKDGIVVNKDPNSEMVEISGSGCVPIDTRNTGLRRAYTVNETGAEQIMMPINVDAYPTNIYSLVRRDGNVSVHGLVPDSPTDTVLLNKKYVADNYVEKVKFTNLEQALNGYILDTTEEAYADLDSAVLKNSVAVGDNVYPIADKTRALVTRIGGKTTKMVQLLDKSKFSATTTNNGVTFTNNGDGTITVNGTATAVAAVLVNNNEVPNIKNHIYCVLGSPFGGSPKTYAVSTTWGSENGAGIIQKNTKDITSGNYWIHIEPGYTANNLVFTPQLFDLTAMNREDITTVEQFKAEFPDLYPYENGNIYPAKISGVKFYEKQDKSGEQASVTLPETYDLHGIGDYKDYLDITKNENNDLYTLKKIQAIDKHVFDGTETWAVYNRVNFENVAFRTTLLADKYTGWYSRGNLMNLLVNIKTLSADKKGYTHGDNSSNIYISLPNIATPAEMKAHVLAMYEAGTPYIFYGAIATPVETVIATNLTYEQVTAIRHNGGLIEVEDNTNKGYAKPTIKNTVVYRLTATNTAEV